MDGPRQPAAEGSGRDADPASISPRERLAADYRATRYHVCDSPLGPFLIRCGERSPEVAALLTDEPVGQWAFVTAENPGSVRLDRRANAERMRQLRAAVEALGFRHYPGRGEGIGGDWPAEESLLIVGVPEAEAVALGRQFGQLAILTGSRHEPARLVWLDSPGCGVTSGGAGA